MNKYMQMAIDLALENVKEGGTPYGSVLVYKDEVIGRGVNTLHKEYDVSGHAEMIAIRQGQKLLETNDLSGATVYASGHPCPMCLSAIAIAGISDVVYANSVEEGAEVGLGISKHIYDYLSGKKEALDLRISHIKIEDPDKDPMILYRKTK